MTEYLLITQSVTPIINLPSIFHLRHEISGLHGQALQLDVCEMQFMICEVQGFDYFFFT